jgi:hypothetical protein
MLDYFRITVDAHLDECEKLFHDCFAVSLSGLSDLPHDAKGFKGVKGALLGFQLKHTPGEIANIARSNFLVKLAVPSLSNSSKISSCS